MDFEISAAQFRNIKNQILSANDLSKKGNVDEVIVDLINDINALDDFVTTSSCSGRTIVLSKDNQNEQKKGCVWVYSTHQEVVKEEFLDNVQTSDGNLVFKFEPFILHVQCRTLKCAKNLLCSALDCGYRNSGIVLGKHGKIIVAVRNTLNLEIPIKQAGKLLVSEEFLSFIIDQANIKMNKNHVQIAKFKEVFSKKNSKM